MKTKRHFIFILFTISFVFQVGLLPAAIGAEKDDLPVFHIIPNVPWHKQITGISCGAGSLEIVFDYHGPDINQKEIADVARTSSSGTWPADIVRTGHFSYLSSAMGSFYPSVAPEAGFEERPIGYAAFSHSSRISWLDELKRLIANDYPVIVLMGFYPDSDSVGHYRVVIGYDDDQELIYFIDPWGRDIMKPSDFTGIISWSYADFETAWFYTDGSDDPFFGAVIMPWEIELAADIHGAKISVEATITYPCPAPMDNQQYPATDVRAEIYLPEGVTLAKGESRIIEIGPMAAGETETVTWQLTYEGDLTGKEIKVMADGIIDGAVPDAAWAGNKNFYPAYSYTDIIGGEAGLQFMDQVDP